MGYAKGIKGHVSKYDTMIVYLPRKWRAGKLIRGFTGKDKDEEFLAWSYTTDIAKLIVRDRWSGDEWSALEYADRIHRIQQRAELERKMTWKERQIFQLEQAIRGDE